MRCYGLQIYKFQQNFIFDIIMERVQYTLKEFLEKNQLSMKEKISIIL